MRGDALLRVLRMTETLRRGRRSVDELAAAFKVTTRTVRRDLEVLSVAGVPVRSTKDAPAGRTAYWWVEV